MVSECSSKNTCFQPDCGKKHHTTLHEYFLERSAFLKAKRKKKKEKNANDDNAEEEEGVAEDATHNGLNIASPETTAEEGGMVAVCTSMTSKSVYLLVVAVTVHVNQQRFDTYALLDDGSQSSLLRYEFYQMIGAVGRKKSVYESTINCKAQKPVEVEELSLIVWLKPTGDQVCVRAAKQYVQHAFTTTS